MDIIEKQILDEALKHYRGYLLNEMRRMGQDDLKRYGRETNELMAKCENLIKRTWVGCL